MNIESTIGPNTKESLPSADGRAVDVVKRTQFTFPLETFSCNSPDDSRLTTRHEATSSADRHRSGLLHYRVKRNALDLCSPATTPLPPTGDGQRACTTNVHRKFARNLDSGAQLEPVFRPPQALHEHPDADGRYHAISPQALFPSGRPGFFEDAWFAPQRRLSRWWSTAAGDELRAALPTEVDV